MNKIAVNTWGFDPRLSIYERFKLIQRLGCHTLEVNFEENVSFPMLTWDTSKKKLTELREFLKSEEVDISSICTELFWQYSLISPVKDEALKAMQLAKIIIDYAQFLEISSVLVVPGVLGKPFFLQSKQPFQTSESAWNKAIDIISELGAYAKERNVIIGLENVHFNNFLTTPKEMKDFIEEVNNPFVKVHFDIGNAQISADPKDWILTLQDYIHIVHVKDILQLQGTFAGYCPPFFGSVDWKSVCNSLSEIRYQGILVAEQSFKSFGNNEILAFIINSLETIKNSIKYEN